MKKKIYNIVLAIATIAATALIITEPFGVYTDVTFAINSVVVFMIFPAISAGIVANNKKELL